MEPEWEPVDTWHAGFDRWTARLPMWARLIFLPVVFVIVLAAFLQAGFSHPKMCFFDASSGTRAIWMAFLCAFCDSARAFPKNTRDATE
jgi:hypothetical protein